MFEFSRYYLNFDAKNVFTKDFDFGMSQLFEFR